MQMFGQLNSKCVDCLGSNKMFLCFFFKYLGGLKLSVFVRFQHTYNLTSRIFNFVIENLNCNLHIYVHNL